MRKVLAAVAVGALATLTGAASAGDLTKTYNSIDQGAPGWGDFGAPWIDGENAEMRIELFVSDHGIIDTFDFVTAINFSHTWIGDLTVILEHKETGLRSVLVNRPGLGPFDDPPGPGCCGYSTDIGGDYTFADGFQTWAEAGGGSFLPPGTYGPDGVASGPTPLNVFDGIDKWGIWSLSVYDGAFADLGSIQGFEIAITNIPAPGSLALLGVAGLVGSRRRRRA